MKNDPGCASTPVPARVSLRPTPDQQLNGLLRDWHHWHASYQLTTGHRAESAGMGDYRAPRHHDWANGAEDARAEREQLEAIGRAIMSLPDEPERWRTAIFFEARNIAEGITVWFSPRMPKTKAERDVLIREARNKLLKELIRTGLMG